MLSGGYRFRIQCVCQWNENENTFVLHEHSTQLSSLMIMKNESKFTVNLFVIKFCWFFLLLTTVRSLDSQIDINTQSQCSRMSNVYVTRKHYIQTTWRIEMSSRCNWLNADKRRFDRRSFRSYSNFAHNEIIYWLFFRSDSIQT